MTNILDHIVSIHFIGSYKYLVLQDIYIYVNERWISGQQDGKMYRWVEQVRGRIDH